jgi:hypothetical protein
MPAPNKPAANQGPMVRAKRPPIEQPELSLVWSLPASFQLPFGTQLTQAYVYVGGLAPESRSQLALSIPVQVVFWQVPGPLLVQGLPTGRSPPALA